MAVTSATSPDDAWLLWGKADPARAAQGGPDWHPLLCHMLDVVECARQLMVNVQPSRLRALASAISLPEDQALPWLLFLVGLHDIGKATPSFQCKVVARKEKLLSIGLDFPNSDKRHGILAASLATRVLSEVGVPVQLARWLARSIGAHHGEFASLEAIQRLEAEKGILLPVHSGKQPLWSALRGKLMSDLAAECGITESLTRPSFVEALEIRHAFVVDLAGLTTVSDWLGSNENVFNYVDPPESAAGYREIARERAEACLKSSGWRRSPRSSRRDFFELFKKRPWPLHDVVDSIKNDIPAPALIIIEAPMGEGKTEAALALFDAFASREPSGLYFALPTQASSNQILGRVERFTKDAFPGEAHGLHLVHGDAGLSERYDQLKERAFELRSVGDVAGRGDGPVADAWFARSKRALLAPLGVGTVDQALLGVLAVRHGFLRLHGLAGKVFVVDEVHAYDVYTSTLLERLLEWLRPLGVTVVLLSATLPANRRERLMRAWGSAPPESGPYPRITVARKGETSFARHFLPQRPPQSVSISWLRGGEIPGRLGASLRDGGCAAWILNTVAAAQSAYRQLLEMRKIGQIPTDTLLRLLHSRYPHDSRSDREVWAETSFGPQPAARPNRAILVGTQVLEQSLDLDFDLMVSEFAPADLLLQRAGRLHRHAGTRRPAFAASPALWLMSPGGDDRVDGPTFGSSRYVYSEHVLLRSWLALRGKTFIILPDEIEPLVERVYAGTSFEVPEPLAARLEKLELENEGTTLAQKQQAKATGLLLPPGDEDPLNGIAYLGDEDDPSLHSKLRPATRLGELSLELVPITERDGEVMLFPASDLRLDLDSSEPLPREIAVKIARAAIRVSHRGLVPTLLKDPVPRRFEKTGHLRFHRLLRLDERGHASVAGTPVVLDDDLGLIIGLLDETGDEPGREEKT